MGRPQPGQAEEVTSGASGRAGCSTHAQVGPDERVYAGDGGRGVEGKWAVGGLKASGRCPRRRSTWRPRAGEG